MQTLLRQDYAPECHDSTPELHSSEEVELKSLGATLKARFVPAVCSEASAQPVVIVCHGAGEFKENYHEMAAHLSAKGIASLLLDMHGHGGSGGASYHVRMHEWIADISSALDYLEKRPDVNAGRIGAFGLSSGGTAILEAALKDKRIKALTLLDATVMNTLPWGVSMTMRMICLAGALKRLFLGSDLRISIVSLLDNVPMASDPEINERLRKDPGKLKAFMNFPMPGAADAFFVNTIRRAQHIQAPTLVIWGGDDQLDPPSTAMKLHQTLTCEKNLLIVEGNGHVGHLDRNRVQVFEAIAEWLLKYLN